MLDDVTFEPRMGSSEYHERRDALRERLMVLQQQAKAVGLGTVVLFEGWGAAGKGARISDLVVGLDPHLCRVYTTEDPVGYEARMPFMTRFWTRLGAHGTMTVFDQAYLDELVRSYVEDVRHADATPGLDKDARDALAQRARQSIHAHVDSALAFERQVQADGYLVVRFFLHITAEEQRRRVVDMMLDRDAAWKVDEHDVRQMQDYDGYRKVFDRCLEMSAEKGAAWHVVPALHKRNANVQIMQTLVDEMTAALEARGFDTSRPIPAGDAACAYPAPAPEVPEEPAAPEPPESPEPAGPAAGEGAPAKVRAKDVIGSAKRLTSRFKLVSVPALDDVSYGNVLAPDEYARALKKEQEELSELSLRLYRRRVPLIVAYEGWDAAGKGGNIKRVTAAMDARSYEVHPICAPTADELAHPFLWRFWCDLPRTGHVAIFDRTWYGRVLVERVEGFARPEEWKRAYDEINEFEEDLRVWGAVLVKLWVDVSPEEQLRRFRERQEDPTRRWKITEEDWRNREKNDLYRRCVNDMLRLTSTAYAPWHIVESDDKRFARVKALRIINESVRRRLAE